MDEKNNLTPLGRNGVIKSTLKFFYYSLFLTLSNHFLKELNTILFSEGGLGMIDIFSYVKALISNYIKEFKMEKSSVCSLSQSINQS